MLGLAAALGIAVVAHARFLAEAAQLAEAVVDLHLGFVLALAGQFAGAPFQVDADHVVHAERPHGEAEALQRGVHLMRVGAFEQHRPRLAHVGLEHAVADEARAVAGYHADLAHALAKFLGSLQHGLAGLGTANDFQQLHDVRGAEEVQAQDLLGTPGDGSDGVDIQRRGVAGENAGRLHDAVQLAEDVLLQLQVFVNRLDHQIDVFQRLVIDCLADAGAARLGLLLADPALANVVSIGVAHHTQRLFEHLGVVVQPQHLHTGVGQAHDDATAHGAGTDDGGALDIEAGLAHCSSPRRKQKNQKTYLR